MEKKKGSPSNQGFHRNRTADESLVTMNAKAGVCKTNVTPDNLQRLHSELRFNQRMDPRAGYWKRAFGWDHA